MIILPFVVVITSVCGDDDIVLSPVSFSFSDNAIIIVFLLSLSLKSESVKIVVDIFPALSPLVVVVVLINGVLDEDDKDVGLTVPCCCC